MVVAVAGHANSSRTKTAARRLVISQNAKVLKAWRNPTLLPKARMFIGIEVKTADAAWIRWSLAELQGGGGSLSLRDRLRTFSARVYSLSLVPLARESRSVLCAANFSHVSAIFMSHSRALRVRACSAFIRHSFALIK